MRIIGGAHRGRALASVGKGDTAAHLRPTADRVRESLFNVLKGGRYGDPVTGVHVLDLFAGTGALGLEAMSRGAARVTFVENGRKALALIRENVAVCRSQEVTRILAKDAARIPVCGESPARLVFLDPPYGKGLGEVALARALVQGWVAPDALIVWEDSADIVPPPECRLVETRSFGQTRINFLVASQTSDN